MLKARNSVHKSAAFGRNRLSHRSGRNGDSPPVVVLASCPDPARLLKDDGKPLVELDSKEQSVDQDSVSTEASIHEKRAAKWRRQKDESIKQNSNSDEPTFDFLSHVVSSDEPQLPEYLQITDGGVELLMKDVTGFSLGNQNKSEVLGLAFVKNELSLSSTDISECSESISLELDEYEGESAKLEQLESGRSDTLSGTLDPVSSITDSSGVETSSDADGEHHTFSTNSSASSVKDHDIINDAYVGCDLRGGQLTSLQWDQTDEEFTVVTKKKKSKTPMLNEEHKSVSAQALGDKNSFQKDEDYNPSKSTISISTVDPMTQHSVSNSLPFLNQNQSLDIAHDSVNCVSAAKTTRSIDDAGSTCTDDTSSEMGFSQFDFDDFPSFPSKTDNNWTVVKTVRRTKSATKTISSETAIENRKGLSVEIEKCSGDVSGSSMTGRSRMKSGFEGQSQNSRYANNRDDTDLKNCQRLNERNWTQVGFSGTCKRGGSMSNGANRGGGDNFSKGRRNPSRMSSVNGNYVSAGFKEYSTIHPMLNITEKCEHSSCNGSRNNTELKCVSVTSTDVLLEQSCLCRTTCGTSMSCHHNGAVFGKFDVEAAAMYVEDEYQKIMMENKKNPELVAIYDPSKDV